MRDNEKIIELCCELSSTLRMFTKELIDLGAPTDLPMQTLSFINTLERVPMELSENSRFNVEPRVLRDPDYAVTLLEEAVKQLELQNSRLTSVEPELVRDNPNRLPPLPNYVHQEPTWERADEG